MKQKILAVLKYTGLSSAVILQVVHAALAISGHAPWSPSQDAAVSRAVDAIATLLAAFGVHQAATDPNDAGAQAARAAQK